MYHVVRRMQNLMRKTRVNHNISIPDCTNMLRSGKVMFTEIYMKQTLFLTNMLVREKIIVQFDIFIEV